MEYLSMFFFLNGKTGLDGPRESFKFIVDTITGSPLTKRGKYNQTQKNCKKDPERRAERDQVPLGAHLAVDEEPAQSGHRTTAGDAPLGEAQ
jgi:hypothetical protein